MEHAGGRVEFEAHIVDAAEHARPELDGDPALPRIDDGRAAVLFDEAQQSCLRSLGRAGECKRRDLLSGSCCQGRDAVGTVRAGGQHARRSDRSGAQQEREGGSGQRAWAEMGG